MRHTEEIRDGLGLGQGPACQFLGGARTVGSLRRCVFCALSLQHMDKRKGEGRCAEKEGRGGGHMEVREGTDARLPLTPYLPLARAIFLPPTFPLSRPALGRQIDTSQGSLIVGEVGGVGDASRRSHCRHSRSRLARVWINYATWPLAYPCHGKRSERVMSCWLI
jgi:hypothetical protein